MLEEGPELSMMQKDGGPPIMLGAGSAPGGSGVTVHSAHFEGGGRINATPQRDHHLCFEITDHSRFECRIADARFSHERQPGSLAIHPVGSDYAGEADRTAEAILVRVDPGRLALAAAEDSALDTQLIDRVVGVRSGPVRLCPGLGFGERKRLPERAAFLG